MSLSSHEHPHGVKTVIVPAAGMGTRFLPATKTVPKELLPVVDTPGIELIAEEAAALGASRMAVIVAPNKQEVMRHFGQFPNLVETLSERGKDEQVAKVQRANQLIQPVAVEQAGLVVGYGRRTDGRAAVAVDVNVRWNHRDAPW